MTNRTAATRYARALFDVAQAERVEPEALQRQLVDLDALLTTHGELRRALVNPAVPAARKRAAVEALVAQIEVAPVVGRTLVLLAERNRVAMLPDVVAAFTQRVQEYRGIVHADITTATALSPQQLESIRTALATATGRTVTVAAAVNADLIGGLVAKVGGTVFDASVTTHLKRLRARLDASL